MNLNTIQHLILSTILGIVLLSNPKTQGTLAQNSNITSSSKAPIQQLSADATLAQAQAEVESTIPETLYPCLPRFADRVEQLGQVQQEQETFYLLGIFENDRYWELLAQTDEAGCLLIKGQQDTESLSAYIPLELAQQLALQRYQRRIEEAGGLQAFQQGFTEYMMQQPGGSLLYLSPAPVWAFPPLFVEIPEGSYEIRRPNTAPNFERLPEPRSRHSQ
ncbi:hypothetical protein C7B61_09890 [filamentous cyanobacterium CCP1]|nr:hypothetical protein C7B61_09890 [filamentous cyanobacterium CCP1]